MDNKGFVPDFYNAAVIFNDISYEMFEFYRDLLGTEVSVTRVLPSDKRKIVLSKTLTSTFEDGKDLLKFNWKVVINQSQMMNIWRRNTQSLEIYDIEDKLVSGDLISFDYFGVSYQFKISSVQAYGIGSSIIRQYSLVPIIEHKI
jgi:hypothetical protein